jgi:hydantoinase/carbamoylase family amidase
MHIEQGPVLALRDAPVGIVSSFVGLIELRVEFAGSAAHAGTTPMHARRDAGRAASAFHVAVNAIAERNGDVVATIGVLELEPGASNVVPGRARAIVDARAQDVPKLDALESAIRQAAGQAAAETRCSVEVVKSLHVAPVPAAPMVVDALRKAAPTAPVLPSGAGHDAQVLAAAGVPTGMVFVRSLADGASHSPAEHTDVADIATAIDTLQRATEFLSPATAD